MVDVEGQVLLFIFEVEGFGAGGGGWFVEEGLVFVEFFPGDFPDDFELLLFLEVEDALLDLIVPGLLVVFPALLDCLPDLVEAADDVLCDFEFQLVDVLVLDVLDGRPDELLVHALAQQRTRLQDKPHLLLAKELSRRVVLVQQKLPR